MALIDLKDTTTLLIIAVVGFVAWLFATRQQSGLSKFPGPFLASITPAYRAWYAYFYPQSVLELELHKKYGPIVRIAPNVLSFSDPDVQAHVYTRDFHKNEAYLAHAPTVHGEVLPNLFSETDFIRHDRLRRAVNRAFSSLNVSQYEPKINNAIDTLVKQLGTKNGSSVDLIDWTFRFAVDVIGDILYGSRYGMLDGAQDMSGIRRTLFKVNRRNNIWRRWPLLDTLFRRNSFLLWLNKQGLYNLGGQIQTPMIDKHLAARLQQSESSSGKLEDMVSELLWAQKLYPDIVTDTAIRGLAESLTNPGSDKMSITLSMIMYFLLTNRNCYDKLNQEVSALFGNSDQASASSFSYDQASKSPYLDAVIKETFRLHPASSTYQERIAPVAGAWVCRLISSTYLACIVIEPCTVCVLYKLTYHNRSVTLK